LSWAKEATFSLSEENGGGGGNGNGHHAGGKRCKGFSDDAGSGDGRQSLSELKMATPSNMEPSYPRAYNYVVRESPPPLQETSSRVQHDKKGQPNVALLPASAHTAVSYGQTRHVHHDASLAQLQKGLAVDPSHSNPEIELSSTDTEDSESIHSNNGGTQTLHTLYALLVNQ